MGELYLGIDIGGTQIKCGLGVDPDLLWHTEFPTDVSSGREGVVAAVLEAVEAARSRAESRPIGGCGIGVPGMVDPNTGRVLHEVANLPDFVGVDFPAILEDRWGIPTAVDNDANLALRGERAFGAARGVDHALLITVGTGVGGAILADGVLLRGLGGGAGEIGHIPVVPGGRRCGCGQKGCLEAYAGGAALRADWIERRSPSSNRALTLRDLIESARGGDGVAVAVFEEAASWLARGLKAALALLNPSLILIGGGIAEHFEPLKDMVESQLRTRSHPSVLHGLQVKRATFGNRSGVLGGIALATEAGRRS